MQSLGRQADVCPNRAKSGPGIAPKSALKSAKLARNRPNLSRARPIWGRIRPISPISGPKSADARNRPALAPGFDARLRRTLARWCSNLVRNRSISTELGPDKLQREMHAPPAGELKMRRAASAPSCRQLGDPLRGRSDAWPRSLCGRELGPSYAHRTHSGAPPHRWVCASSNCVSDDRCARRLAHLAQSRPILVQHGPTLARFWAILGEAER